VGKKFVVQPFFVATKIKNTIKFELTEQNFGQYTKNSRTFNPKTCHEALKNMGLGSEIWVLEKTFSGSRIQGLKRHRIPDPDLQH
jgi:hypothetical protein